MLNRIIMTGTASIALAVAAVLTLSPSAAADGPRNDRRDRVVTTETVVTTRGYEPHHRGQDNRAGYGRNGYHQAVPNRREAREAIQACERRADRRVERRDIGQGAYYATAPNVTYVGRSRLIEVTGPLIIDRRHRDRVVSSTCTVSDGRVARLDITQPPSRRAGWRGY